MTGMVCACACILACVHAWLADRVRGRGVLRLPEVGRRAGGMGLKETAASE